MAMDVDARIKQFRKMAEADPENELGHFSLGNSYLETGRYDEAAASLARAIELNPKMSKAYQLLGEAHTQAGRRDLSVDVLTRGAHVADKQGDRMPRDAMIAMLRELGAPLPEPSKKEQKASAIGGPCGPTAAGFSCSRCGSPTGHLDKSPFKGPLGETVYANVCTSCWREWVSMGTKVINELGLALSSQAGQNAYDQHMIEFLQLESSTHRE